ncbi:alpha/beta hydrolase protein [Rhizophagus irregularis DAOM 181602=DAOM 197198]|nr:alpha/beta hydrolase protein [Rhizophagus irregularis DAOM 181602=DAOM 197198]
MSSRQSWHPLWYDTELGEKFQRSDKPRDLGESIIVPSEYRKFKVQPFDFRDFFSSLDISTLNLIREKDKMISLEHSLQFANLAKKGKKSLIRILDTHHHEKTLNQLLEISQNLCKNFFVLNMFNI